MKNETSAIQRRQLTITLVIWAVLFTVAGLSLFILNRNAIRVVNWLAYVEAPRFSKVQVLYKEGEKHAALAMNRLGHESGTSATLPMNDPDASRALELLRQAMKLDPRERYASAREMHYVLLGDLYGAVGQRAEQDAAYGAAALSRNDLVNAEQYARRALTTEAAPGGARLVLAHVLTRKGESQKEFSELKAAAATSDTAVLSAGYGDILLNKGLAAEAAEQYQKAIQLDPADVNSRKNLANALMVLGKDEEATKVLEEGIQSGWDDGNYLHLYGELLLKLKKYALAEEVLEQATTVEVTSGDIQLSLARAYNLQGKKRYADRAMRRAIALKPELQGKLLNP